MSDDKKPEKPAVPARTTTNETSYEIRGESQGRISDRPKPTIKNKK